jgi:ferredoxin--NADP+ reductase
LYSHAGPSWGEDGAGAVVSTPAKRLIAEFKAEKKGEDPEAHHLFMGVCSNYLCDIPLGTNVRVTGPSGRHFLLPEEPDAWDYLFLATGTGSAPFRGMAMELFRGPKPSSSRVEVVMGVPYTTDLQFDEIFSGLDREFPDFRYHTAISREPHPGYGSKGRYVHHLLRDEWSLFEPFLRSPRTLIYVCGVGGMEVGLYRLLAAQGVHEPYLRIRPTLEGIAPEEWDAKAIPRGIKTTGRCMVEVY